MLSLPSTHTATNKERGTIGNEQIKFLNLSLARPMHLTLQRKIGEYSALGNGWAFAEWYLKLGTSLVKTLAGKHKLCIVMNLVRLLH
jgi:hypothetical protein